MPRHRRRATAEEAAQREAEEAERSAAAESAKERRALQSRAMVAQVVAEGGLGGSGTGEDPDEAAGPGGGPIGLQNEFDESGGSAMPPPNDDDDNLPEGELQRRRDAWEVRELLRVLRGHDEKEAERREAAELERRRGLTDEERLREDVASGRYRRPGGQREGGAGNKDAGRNEAVRFHHRGAFYMDADTLRDAGSDDVRHKAAQYSRAATGDEKFDRSKMPEIMKVKNFGLAGQTKYRGLAKEDTSEKGRDYLPVKRGGAR